LRAWEAEGQLFKKALQSEAAGRRISEALNGWRAFAAGRQTDFRKEYAARRIAYWQNQLDNYTGAAHLTVLSATGLPPSSLVLFGKGAPDPYFVLLEDGKSFYQSLTVPDTPAPQWNERIRVMLDPLKRLEIEIRDRYLISYGRLFRQALTSLPPDGPFRISSGSIEVSGLIERER
jgi:hypothetical protein